MDQLLLKLQNAGLVDSSGNIILEVYEYGVQAVDIETFKVFFDLTDCSYGALVSADNGKGYTRFFDKWHSKGILN